MFKVQSICCINLKTAFWFQNVDVCVGIYPHWSNNYKTGPLRPNRSPTAYLMTFHSALDLVALF